MRPPEDRSSSRTQIPGGKRPRSPAPTKERRSKRSITEHFLDLVHANDLAGCQKMLAANPNLDINCTDQNGNTALIIAASIGSHGTTTWLLTTYTPPGEEAELDIGHENHLGETALLHQVANVGDQHTDNTLSMIDTLLHNKQSINTPAKSGQTPFLRACAYENMDVVSRYLNKLPEQQPDDLNAKNRQGLTALHQATLLQNHDVIAALLNCHAVDINCVDTSSGMTALMSAVETWRYAQTEQQKIASTNTLQLFLNLPASRGLQINDTDNWSKTVLMNAVAINSLPMVQLLLEQGPAHGLNLGLRDRFHQTALMQAHNLKHEKIYSAILAVMPSDSEALADCPAISSGMATPLQMARFHLLNCGIDSKIDDSIVPEWRIGGIAARDAVRRQFTDSILSYSKQCQSPDVWRQVHLGFCALFSLYTEDHTKMTASALSALRNNTLLSFPLRHYSVEGHWVMIHTFTLHDTTYFAYSNRGLNSESTSTHHQQPAGMQLYQVSHPERIDSLVQDPNLFTGRDDSFYLKMQTNEGGLADHLGLTLVAWHQQTPQKSSDCVLHALYSEVLMRLMLQHWKTTGVTTLNQPAVDRCITAVKSTYDRFKYFSRENSYQVIGKMSLPSIPIHAFIGHHHAEIVARGIKHQEKFSTKSSVITETPQSRHASSSSTTTSHLDVTALASNPSRHSIFEAFSRLDQQTRLDDATIAAIRRLLNNTHAHASIHTIVIEAIGKYNITSMIQRALKGSSVLIQTSMLLLAISSSPHGRLLLLSRLGIRQLTSWVSNTQYDISITLSLAMLLSAIINPTNPEVSLSAADRHQAYMALLQAAFESNTYSLIEYALKAVVNKSNDSSALWSAMQTVSSKIDNTSQLQVLIQADILYVINSIFFDANCNIDAEIKELAIHIFHGISKDPRYYSHIPRTTIHGLAVVLNDATAHCTAPPRSLLFQARSKLRPEHIPTMADIVERLSKDPQLLNYMKDSMLSVFDCLKKVAEDTSGRYNATIKSSANRVLAASTSTTPTAKPGSLFDTRTLESPSLPSTSSTSSTSSTVSFSSTA